MVNPKQQAFLAAFAECGNIAASAKAAGVDRSSHYKWLGDPDYASRFAEAQEAACELLEAEARRRAIEGEAELQTYNGEPVFVWVDEDGQVVPADDPRANERTPLYRYRKSDTLVIFLLKSLKPEVYRDRFEHQHSGNAGAAIPVEVTLRDLLDELDRRTLASEAETP